MVSSSTAARLCSACGMCCNGVMFHLVELQPVDSAKELAALGLKLKRKKKKRYIVQPCPAHRDCQCAIYDQRPQRCRLFKCRQLLGVAAGEITEDAAMAKIRTAQEYVTRINALFERLNPASPKRALTLRYDRILEKFPMLPSDPEKSALCEQLTEAVRKLTALLEKDFKPAK